jgi:hypothetical protein
MDFLIVFEMVAFMCWFRIEPGSLLKYPTERRVRARGLHYFLGNHGSCRPGALTGRVFQQAAGAV